MRSKWKGYISINLIISCLFYISTIVECCLCIRKGRDRRGDWDRDAYILYSSASILA